MSGVVLINARTHVATFAFPVLLHHRKWSEKISEIHTFPSYKKCLIRIDEFESWALRNANTSILFCLETKTPKSLKKGVICGEKYETMRKIWGKLINNLLIKGK